MARVLQPDTREHGLPKWAKSILANLRMIVNEQAEALAERALDPATTKVVTGYFSDYPKAVDGGTDRNVTFFPRGYDGVDRFDVRLDGDELLINASDSISLHMSSGNVVRVSFIRGITEDEIAVRKAAHAKGWTREEIRKGLHLGYIPERDSILPPRVIVAKNTRTDETYTAEELENVSFRDRPDIKPVAADQPKGFGQ